MVFVDAVMLSRLHSGYSYYNNNLMQKINRQCNVGTIEVCVTTLKHLLRSIHPVTKNILKAQIVYFYDTSNP